MKKVLIISYSFPPLNNIAARRFSEMVPFFNEQGWEPYILTTESSGDLPLNLPSKNIVRVGKHPQGSTLRQEKPKAGLIARVRRTLGITFRSFDGTYKSWYKKIVNDREILNHLHSLKLDFIISSYGPCAAYYIGSKLSKQLGVPWAVDFRDLGALHKDVEIKKYLFVYILDKWNEKRKISTASFLTTVSSALADDLIVNYNKKTEVIYNGWADYNNKHYLRDELVIEQEKPYIYYAGRFYPHQMDAVLLLIEALKEQEFNFVVRSLGPDYLEEKILNYAKSLGVLSQVKILPPEKSSVIFKEQENSAINLVVEDLDKTYNFKKGVLTGKLMQLLTCQAPVLAIARDDSEIGMILSSTSKGFLASTKEDICLFFDRLKNNNPYCLDQIKIQTYSKRNQACNLIKLLDLELKNEKSK